MKKCICCGLPETYETIEFDTDGVCNICRQQQHKRGITDWTARKVMLGNLIEQYRGKSDYDCLVPSPGEKTRRSRFIIWSRNTKSSR